MPIPDERAKGAKGEAVGVDEGGWRDEGSGMEHGHWHGKHGYRQRDRGSIVRVLGSRY